MAWLTVLGIPAGIYVASITGILFVLIGKQVDPIAAIGGGVLTMGVYILHRTSVHECDSMQRRHIIAKRHMIMLRVLACVAIGIAGVILAMFHPIAPLLIICAVGGIVFYSRSTIVQPLRNITWLKPIAVGFPVASLAWVLAGMPPDVVPVLGIALICSADALLCDLGDRQYDNACECSTLAMHLGTTHAWYIATFVYLLVGGGLFFAYLGVSAGLILLIVFPIPLLFVTFDTRFSIDLRPLLVLLLAWLV